MKGCEPNPSGVGAERLRGDAGGKINGVKEKRLLVGVVRKHQVRIEKGKGAKRKRKKKKKTKVTPVRFNVNNHGEPDVRKLLPVKRGGPKTSDCEEKKEGSVRNPITKKERKGSVIPGGEMRSHLPGVGNHYHQIWGRRTDQKGMEQKANG